MNIKKSAFLYIIIAGMLWGTSGVFYNLLAPFGFSSIQMTAMRGGVSAIVITFYILIYNRALFRVTFREFIVFALSGLSIFGTAAFYYAAIPASSVSTAVILMYTAPMFVMVYSVAFLGEKLNLPKCISVVLMIVGCALVSGIINGMTFSFAGIAFGLASGICYSAYNIFTRVAMMHRSNSLTASLYAFIVMGIASVCICNPAEILTITMKNPFSTVPLIIGIGVCTCVLPYMLYSRALKDIPAGTASALAIIEPMSATLFSVVFFQEKLGAASAIGIVLILTAVFILNKSEG